MGDSERFAERLVASHASTTASIDVGVLDARDQTGSETSRTRLEHAWTRPRDSACPDGWSTARENWGDSEDDDDDENMLVVLVVVVLVVFMLVVLAFVVVVVAVVVVVVVRRVLGLRSSRSA